MDTSPAPPMGGESVEAILGYEPVQPGAAPTWTKQEAVSRKRAPLRIYLGAAPGVGKTVAMLGEGTRRRDRGTDVVVGIVETYGRPHTSELAQGLEWVPPARIEYRDRTFEEMDTAALVTRRPQVALIDELAHTNVPGSRRVKRWEDILDVLAEGIEVVTTVNGIRQQETVPDWFLDVADQIELVDMSPHALRRRMTHGNVYPDPEKADVALRRYFTTENLTALRELALMKVANQADDELLLRWSKGQVPETRERVLVCISRPGFSEILVRRGARIAQRAHGDLFVLHVRPSEEPQDEAWLQEMRRLTEDLGGAFEVVESDSPVDAVVGYAYRQHVTQLVVGEPLKSRWEEMLRGSFVNRLIRASENIDVHVIARKER